MRNKKFIELLIVYGFVMTSANIVHPITPAFIQSLRLEDYMFGVAFAAMALANFIFSNLWGYLSDSKGRGITLCVSCVGYAIGQLLFAHSYDSFSLIIARLLGGAFAGGFSVSALAYVSDISDKEELKQNLSIFAAATALYITFGFFVGGIIGNYSIFIPFYLQAFLLVVGGLLGYFWLVNGQEKQKIYTNKVVESLKPWRIFEKGYKVCGKVVIVALILSFFVFVANTVFDKAFDYYLRDYLNQPPSVNGFTKAIVGIIGLIANGTITIYLIKKTNPIASFTAILTIIFACLIGVFITKEHISYFIGASMVYYVLFAISSPIMQLLVMEEATAKTRGLLSGMLNSFRSISGVIGSLLTGFLYGVNKGIPFLGAIIIVAIAIIISWYLLKLKGEEHEQKKISG